MRFSLMLASILALSTPVLAQEVCVTPEIADQNIRTGVPDAEIVDTNPGEFTITYGAPSMPTNYQLHFDKNGCLDGAVEVSKVQS